VIFKSVEVREAGGVVGRDRSCVRWKWVSGQVEDGDRSKAKDQTHVELLLESRDLETRVGGERERFGRVELRRGAVEKTRSTRISSARS
jgi:hypothetical protein